MQTKTLCKFSRIPQMVCHIALSAAIFTGILVVMVFALALIANGMITLPSAVIRAVGKGSIFVSDLSALTMLFFGGKPAVRAGTYTSQYGKAVSRRSFICIQTFLI